MNVQDIFAKNALIKSIIAANLDVDTLFARDAVITAINTMDISSNTSLRLYVEGELDPITQRLSNAEIRLTDDSIITTVTSSGTYKQHQQQIYDDIDSLLGLRVEILADTVFLTESMRKTILRAQIWHGSELVTDKVAASRFIWTRESADFTADSIWAEAHTGIKSVLVTTADVLHQASFQCDILDDK